LFRGWSSHILSLLLPGHRGYGWYGKRPAGRRAPFGFPGAPRLRGHSAEIM
jgi:hypothetical protein